MFLKSPFFKPSFLMVSCALFGCSDTTIQQTDVENREQIMVVLDSSAAMSETVDGHIKQDLMRDKYGTMVKQWQDNNVDAGLVVFGGQNQNDCADIDLIDTPREVDAVTLGRIAYKLSPTGKAPLSEAVYVAAKHLNPANGPSKIIAITNGQDTCGHDPCLLAGELQEMGLEFEVYNVGNGSESLHCGKPETVTMAPAAGEDDYNSVEGGLHIQALRHDTGEPMWPMKWVLKGGPEGIQYDLIDDNPTLDLSRLQATELRGGDYTITGFSGDYAGSSNFTFGPDTPAVVYVILHLDVPHSDE